MINVRYDKPQKQRTTEYSGYLSFKFDYSILEIIKALPVRFWLPEQKEWEVPTDVLPILREKMEVNELNELPGNTAKLNNLDKFEFKTKPFDHQLEGVKYGLEHKNWLLGDVQGLGKTKQMIDLACYKKQFEGIKHCLIICCVNNLKYNWKNEIEIHSDESAKILGWRKPNKEPTMKDRLDDLGFIPGEFFWITNIETLRMKKEGRFYKSIFVDTINQLIEQGEIGLVIADEIHKCKNSTSGQGRGLLGIKGCCKIGLSGTLLVNKPLDLYTPLKFIGAVNKNQWQFDHTYGLFDIFGNITGYQNLSEIQYIINNVMLRRKKDLLSLPEKLEKVEYIELNKEERKVYKDVEEAVRNEVTSTIDKVKTPASILSKITRLRQVATCGSLISSTVKESSKLNRLKDILEEAKLNNEKVIVFTMFRQIAEICMEQFKEYEPLHIWGQMNQTELQQNVNKFQSSDKTEVLFNVIQAAGTGITLNTASIVVFLDLPWNYATMEQAEDRAHRIGTKHTVTIIRLISKDTYDERLWKKVISRGKMSDALIDMEDIKTVKPYLDCLFEEKEIS